MTRARDQVFLLYQQAPSPFITVMGDSVILREEPLLKPYEQEPPQVLTHTTPAPPPMATPNHSHKIDWDENCENWFSELEVETLNRYFARHVYRDGLRFKEWLTPRGLKVIQPALFYKVHKCPATLVSAIIYKIESKGIRLSHHHHPHYR